MCARAELWRPRGSAAAFSASSAAAPWPSVTEDDVGSFRKWRFEARSPGPRTYPPTLRRWGRPQLRKVWASRGRIPPGVRLASDVYSPSAHLLPPAGLPALSLGGPSLSRLSRARARESSNELVKPPPHERVRRVGRAVVAIAEALDHALDETQRVAAPLGVDAGPLFAHDQHDVAHKARHRRPPLGEDRLAHALDVLRE